MRPSWQFKGLKPAHYDFIMADPPWRFRTYSLKGKLKKAPELHYETMTREELLRLPVHLLAKSDCLLWLWTTGAMIASGDAHETLDAWGFKAKTLGVWAKRTKTWTPESEEPLWAFGTGYILRESAEYFLIGTRGAPKTRRSTRSLVEGAQREHSRKPEEAYVAAERLMPNATRADLFSRQKRIGWDNWGKEADKFEKT